MNTTKTVADPVYETFKDSGVTLPLVALIGCKSLVCLIGVMLNLNIVYITIKTKTLRSSCNMQIALNALSIAVQECSSFVTLAVVVSGTNFIPLHICALIQFLPLFCTIFTNGMALTIGIDRLISVIFPIWYLKNSKDRNYLYSIVAVCALYASFVPIVALNVSLQNPTIPVMCTVIDPAQKEATWIVIMLLVVNSFSVCCYILVWLIILFRQNMVKKQKNVFKSLSMILVLELFGWMTNYSIRLMVKAADIHLLNIWYIVNISTIAPYFSMSISPIVLCVFSIEYRRAFLFQLPAKLSVRIAPLQKSSNQLQIQRRVTTEMSQRYIHSRINNKTY